jgi:hypothetical protein
VSTAEFLKNFPNCVSISSNSASARRHRRCGEFGARLSRLQPSQRPDLSGLDPDTGEIVGLFHPRRDLWAEHFVYKGVHIIGTTPTARATASLLAVNDPERLRIRKVTAQIYK